MVLVFKEKVDCLWGNRQIRNLKWECVPSEGMVNERGDACNGPTALWLQNQIGL